MQSQIRIYNFKEANAPAIFSRNLIGKISPKFTIESFHITWQMIDQDEPVKTPPFSADRNGSKVVLRLCKNKNDKRYLSLQLSSATTFDEPGCNIKWNASLLTSKREKFGYVESELQLFKNIGDVSTFDNFIELDFVLNEANNLLPNGVATICCEGRLYSAISTIEENIKDLFPVTPQNKLLNDLHHLFQDNDSSDVTLSVSGNDLQAHKVVPAARSSVLADMIKRNIKDQTPARIEISDVNDADVVKRLLEFVYTGSVSNIKDKDNDLLVLANRYEFEGLKLICEDALSKSSNRKC